MLIKMLTWRNDSLITEGKYRLHYEIGMITHALSGTVGIFCWDTDYLDREEFHINPDSLPYEVEGEGRKESRHYMPC